MMSNIPYSKTNTHSSLVLSLHFLASMTAALAGNTVSNAAQNAFDTATTAGTPVQDVPAPEGPCDHTWKNLYYAGVSYDALIADIAGRPNVVSVAGRNASRRAVVPVSRKSRFARRRSAIKTPSTLPPAA